MILNLYDSLWTEQSELIGLKNYVHIFSFTLHKYNSETLFS